MKPQVSFFDYRILGATEHLNKNRRSRPHTMVYGYNETQQTKQLSSAQLTIQYSNERDVSVIRA